MKLYNAHNKTGVRELWLGKPQLSGSVSLNLTAVSSAERLLPVVFSDMLCRFTHVPLPSASSPWSSVTGCADSSFYISMSSSQTPKCGVFGQQPLSSCRIALLHKGDSACFSFLK